MIASIAPPHPSSASSSNKQRIAGERRGIIRGIEMCASLLEREGDHIGAQRLREAIVINGETGK